VQTILYITPVDMIPDTQKGVSAPTHGTDAQGNKWISPNFNAIPLPGPNNKNVNVCRHPTWWDSQRPWLPYIPVFDLSGNCSHEIFTCSKVGILVKSVNGQWSVSEEYIMQWIEFYQVVRQICLHLQTCTRLYYSGTMTSQPIDIDYNVLRDAYAYTHEKLAETVGSVHDGVLEWIGYFNWLWITRAAEKMPLEYSSVLTEPLFADFVKYLGSFSKTLKGVCIDFGLHPVSEAHYDLWLTYNVPVYILLEKKRAVVREVPRHLTVEGLGSKEIKAQLKTNHRAIDQSPIDAPEMMYIWEPTKNSRKSTTTGKRQEYQATYFNWTVTNARGSYHIYWYKQRISQSTKKDSKRKPNEKGRMEVAMSALFSDDGDEDLHMEECNTWASSDESDHQKHLVSKSVVKKKVVPSLPCPLRLAVSVLEPKTTEVPIPEVKMSGPQFELEPMSVDDMSVVQPNSEFTSSFQDGANSPGPSRSVYSHHQVRDMSQEDRRSRWQRQYRRDSRSNSPEPRNSYRSSYSDRSEWDRRRERASRQPDRSYTHRYAPYNGRKESIRRTEQRLPSTSFVSRNSQSRTAEQREEFLERTTQTQHREHIYRRSCTPEPVPTSTPIHTATPVPSSNPVTSPKPQQTTTESVKEAEVLPTAPFLSAILRDVVKWDEYQVDHPNKSTCTAMLDGEDSLYGPHYSSNRSKFFWLFWSRSHPNLRSNELYNIGIQHGCRVTHRIKVSSAETILPHRCGLKDMPTPVTATFREDMETATYNICYMQDVIRLLKRPNARGFLERGGIIWRLALEFGGRELWEDAFKGPSVFSVELRRGERCPDIGYISEEVTQEECGILTGTVYVPGEEAGSLRMKRSLFPPVSAWEESKQWIGVWSRNNESWFQERLKKLHDYQLTPDPWSIWRQNLRTKRATLTEQAAENYLQS
jgi:hypothetical protein